MMFFLVFHVYWNAFENCFVQPLRGWGLLRDLFPLVAPGAIHVQPLRGWDLLRTLFPLVAPGAIHI